MAPTKVKHEGKGANEAKRVGNVAANFFLLWKHYNVPKAYKTIPGRKHKFYLNNEHDAQDGQRVVGVAGIAERLMHAWSVLCVEVNQVQLHRILYLKNRRKFFNTNS